MTRLYCLGVTCLLAVSVQAQSTVHLRASFQGRLLPSKTELVVLARESRVQIDGRHQPEFMSADAFPRHGRILRDRLGSGGASARAYPTTTSSGDVYFLYALTPDSTLYWSFSALRDSLKYDVVQTGMMSVAPVLLRSARDEILRTFFSSAPRVTVYMPDDPRPEEENVADSAMPASPVRIDHVEDEWRAEPGLAAPAGRATGATFPGIMYGTGAHTADSVVMRPAASLYAPTERSGRFPRNTAIAFLLMALLLAAAPALLAHRYRQEIRRLRTEVPMGSSHAVSDARLEELSKELEDAELRRRHVEEDYEILLARLAALEREIESYRREPSDDRSSGRSTSANGA